MTRSTSKVELWIAVSYALFGGLWILLSDKLVAVFSVDISTLSRIQTYKGWAFVAASTLLIYYLLRYDRRHKQSNEKELNETQTRLRSVLDNAPIVLISVDRKGVFTLSEGAGLERTGLKPGQVVGQSAYDLYGSFPIFLPNGNAISGDDLLNRVYNGEKIIAHTELNGVHFENRFAPLLTRDGTVDGLVGVAIDVTQRNQFEENLRKAEAQYRTLVEQIPPIVYIADPNQYIGVTYISPRISTLGFTQNEWVADPELWFRQIHPEDQKRVLDEIEQIKQSDAEGIKRNAEAFKMEYRLLSRDGTERWFLDEVLNVFNDHGKILFRQGIMLDITERKRTEEKIAYQANLLANVNDAILASDEKFVLTTWNSAAEKMYGWKAEEVIGKSGTEILQTEFLTISRPEAIQQLMETGEFFAEVSQLRKNGTKIYVETRATALRDLNGKTTGYITVNRDITERRRTEEELRAINTKLKKVLEVETVGVMFWDLTTGIMTDANDAFLKLMGYSRREVEAGELTWQRLTPAEYMEASLAEVRKFQESGRVGPYEKEYFRKDGTRQWLVFAGSSLGGNTSVEFCVDISDRKRVEKVLQESEKKYRDLVETAHDLIWAVDPQGRITFLNQASKRIYGYEPEELMGRSFFDLLSPEERDRQLEDFPRLPADGGDFILGIETEVLDRDGNRHMLVANAVRVYDQDGNLAGTMGTSTDITERKKAEEKIKYQIARTETLVRTAANLNRDLELDAVIQAVCRNVLETFDVSQCAIALKDDKHDSLVYAGGVNITPEEVAVMEPISRTHFEEIAKAMGPLIIVPNVQEMQGLPNAELNKSQDIRTVVVSTLSRDEQLIGTLTLGVKGRERVFSADDQFLLRALSSQAAQAIINAKLLETEKEQRLRLRALSRRLTNVQETEQRAIGRELHDQIGQMLTVIKITLDIIPQLPIELAARKIDQAREIAADLLTRVSQLSLELRPPMLDDLGFFPALLWHINHYRDQVGIPVEFNHSAVEGRRFDTEIETTAYRVVQEALTNIARHAQANSIKLDVRLHGGQIEIQIADNGQGFDPEIALAKNHGLSAMRERVYLVGGRFQVDSAAGMGSRLLIQLPVEKEIV